MLNTVSWGWGPKIFIFGRKKVSPDLTVWVWRLDGMLMSSVTTLRTSPEVPIFNDNFYPSVTCKQD